MKGFAQLPNHSLFEVERHAQDVLAISAPNYLQRGSEQKNDAGNPECKSSRAKTYYKKPCDDCNRVDYDGRDGR